MSKLVKNAEMQIYTAVEAALKKAMETGLLPEAELLGFKVEIPADRKNGDYSTNAAMAHARAFRLPPQAFGSILVTL